MFCVSIGIEISLFLHNIHIVSTFIGKKSSSLLQSLLKFLYPKDKCICYRILPVVSRPLSCPWTRWMFNLAAISLPFSAPAFDLRDPDDWGCILVAWTNLSRFDVLVGSALFKVSSTTPLYEKRKST
jgi:hypothetical protein